MRTILVWAVKGGSGKSTISRELAVANTRQGRRVALLDLDPQGSTTGWYSRREADAPVLVSTQQPAAWYHVADAGFDDLVVDTAPGLAPNWSSLVAAADVVVVPVRPSPDDVLAAAATAERLAQHPTWAFVLTQTPPRARLVDGAVRQLAALGRLAPVSIGFRMDYPGAAVSGNAAVEYPDTKSASEVEQLRRYVDGLKGSTHG